MRVLDPAAVAAARARRLEALEGDVDEEAARAAEAAAADDEYEFSEGDAGDDSGMDASPAPKKRSRARGKKSSAADARKRRRTSGRSTRAAGTRKPAGLDKWNKNLATVLEEEGPGGPSEQPGGYWAIAALPSVKPPRPLCSVCGFRAPYTCTRCMVRFCSIKCGTAHEETRCLKYTL